MTRRQHLQKAWDALGQVIEHLQRAGEEDMVFHDDIKFREAEDHIINLIDAEPHGKDTDDAYEEMVERETGL
jgi:hypothetical protein